MKFAAFNSPVMLRPPLRWRWSRWCVALSLIITALAGCMKSEADAALETDANGYLCQNCRAKFYTDRKVFADICPGCKSFQLSQVVGFSCSEDNHITVAARGSGFTSCEKCQRNISNLVIPKEEDLTHWGAAKKSKTEVTKS